MKCLNFALGSVALAAALLTPVAASAGTVVDTGTPVGGTTFVLDSNQNLAGYFSVGTATTITGFDGYINGVGGNGTVTATLYSDGSTPSAGNALFSTVFATDGSESWQGAAGLNWAVGPANYWLGFSTGDFMGMRNGAPNPLTGYAVINSGQWFRFDNLDIGIRVFDGAGGAIPEPGTWALLVLGFGAIGAGMRTRRRAPVAVCFAA